MSDAFEKIEKEIREEERQIIAERLKGLLSYEKISEITGVSVEKLKGRKETEKEKRKRILEQLTKGRENPPFKIKKMTEQELKQTARAMFPNAKIVFNPKKK
ncbi:hypothetical protein ACOJQI_22840 (plasmid) [Bacillus salacetis]|uniref:hypothetical protein n=1 Tax=Bacillus salacetis TaxID=2315464 RepID=UPI003B9E439E